MFGAKMRALLFLKNSSWRNLVSTWELSVAMNIPKDIVKIVFNESDDFTMRQCVTNCSARIV
jgi:hypothetical protein